MGKATKWLKSLFGKPGSGIQSKAIPPNISQSALDEHAIAVAVATTVAADAAVAASRAAGEASRAAGAASRAAGAASQAAAAVVRLTSQGRGTSMFGTTVHGRLAAVVKIQSVARGYLARKALRALKAVVKLQAFVRGDLMRKKLVYCLQRTPRFMINSPARFNAQQIPPAAAAKGGRANNFTAYTQSFKAKTRSRSAPKQRAERLGKKAQCSNEGAEYYNRRSSSGARLQRSCTQIQQAMDFKNIAITTPYYYSSNKQRKSKHHK